MAWGPRVQRAPCPDLPAALSPAAAVRSVSFSYSDMLAPPQGVFFSVPGDRSNMRRLRFLYFEKNWPRGFDILSHCSILYTKNKIDKYISLLFSKLSLICRCTLQGAKKPAFPLDERRNHFHEQSRQSFPSGDQAPAQVLPLPADAARTTASPASPPASWPPRWAPRPLRCGRTSTASAT